MKPGLAQVGTQCICESPRGEMQKWGLDGTQLDGFRVNSSATLKAEGALQLDGEGVLVRLSAWKGGQRGFDNVASMQFIKLPVI